MLQTPNIKPGCYDRQPYVESYRVQDGYSISVDGAVVAFYKEQAYINSKDCQYSQDVNDPACAGCKHNKGGKRGP